LYVIATPYPQKRAERICQVAILPAFLVRTQNDKSSQVRIPRSRKVKGAREEVSAHAAIEATAVEARRRVRLKRSGKLVNGHKKD
jgi:hypothetical protein